jgi:hypothetical protein
MADESLDRLFATSPGEFIRERNALATHLAKARDPRAGEVKGIPKPTIPVWALNALARERPKQVAALLEAGERLRTAQRDALRGRGGEALRAVGAELGDLLAQLVGEAAEAVARAGASPTASVLKRVEDGLRAVALSGGDLALRLRSGHLEREPELPQLETIVAAAPAESRAPSPKERRPARKAEAARKAADAAARAAATKRVAAVESALRREERNLERLERDAADAERRVGEARERVARAREELATLERNPVRDVHQP